MLRQLRISQLVLVEEADISFEAGLHVLSGETGSGKSAVLGALQLVLGGKADTQLIRRGADKGRVEAVFGSEQNQAVAQLLDAAGIPQEEDEDLIIARELNVNGKSRAWINHRPVSASLLRQVAPNLMDIVTQHANARLLQLDYHRSCLDTFGDLGEARHSFQEAWEEERSLRKELDALVQQEAARLREIEVCKMEIEELEQANLQEGEEEELFSEFSRLSNSESLQRIVSGIVEPLSDGRHAVLGSLAQCRGQLQQLVEMDPTLDSLEESLQSATLELEELAYSLRNYQAGISHDPIRLSEVDERLSLMNRLKRKYGGSVEEVLTYLEKQQERLQELTEADQRVDEIEAKLHEAVQATNAAATALTEGRKRAAEKLSEEITQEMRTLNMPRAELRVAVEPAPRNSFGEDSIEFMLSPNLGERFVSLKDGISGGEIARVMLSLKRVLAGKDKVGVLVFDEVDANIGGKTATVIGETLREISQQHQVLCITHFPQVACCADVHFQITKQESQQRTLTRIRRLQLNEVQEELQRMLGGSALI